MLRTSHFVILLTFFLTAEFSWSSPVLHHSPYVVKESFSVPQKWSRLARAPSNHVLNLQIALRQSQFDDLERDLYEGKTIARQCIYIDNGFS